MNIALMAHDSKKELMTQFCIAYCGILSRHSLCATGTTGKLVAEATGLDIQRFLSGSQGGDQQIASRIACAISCPSSQRDWSFIIVHKSSTRARSPDLPFFSVMSFNIISSWVIPS